MKRKLSIILLLSLILSMAVFADVDNTQTYGKALKEIGVIVGDENGNLKGDEILTREQSVATLIRLLGVQESELKSTKTKFKDVPADNWAMGYISYAEANGLTYGVSDTEFGLGRKVTTQEYATFMLRALGYRDKNVFSEAVAMATKQGILRDVKNAKATDTVKRSDAFTMMYNSLTTKLKGSETTLAAKLYKTLPEIKVVKEDTSKNTASLYPLSITNYDDSTLVIEKKPQRVASLVLGTDEILLGLDDPKYIVGLSGQTATKGSGFLAVTEASKYPKMERNIEVILKQKPDMVIGSGGSIKKIKEQLNDSGIQYYAYKTPHTIEEFKQVVLDFANVLGEPEKGKAIADDWNKRLVAIKEKAKTIKEEDKLTVLPYNMHGKTNAKGHVVDEIIYLIGAKNAATEAGMEKRAEISKGKIIELDPDVIYIMAYAMDDLSEFDKFVEDIKNDPAYKNLKAVKNDRIIVADNRYLMIVTQHLIDGVEHMAKSVYPEVYGK